MAATHFPSGTVSPAPSAATVMAMRKVFHQKERFLQAGLEEMGDSETKVQEDSNDYHLRKRKEPVQCEEHRGQRAPPGGSQQFPRCRELDYRPQIRK